jgi:chromosome partitioning protein
MKFDNTHVISLANQKGGCGKTTSAVSLSAALAELGYSVTLVDTDPQCNATDYFGIDREELAREGKLTIADALIFKRSARDIEYSFGDRFNGLLHVIPGHRGLGTAERRLESELQTYLASGSHSDLEADELKHEHRLRLRTSIESLFGTRDIVLIDTPPELGFLMTSALIASDWYVLPVFPSGFDLQGLEALTRTVDKVQQRYSRRLILMGVLLGNIDSRAKLDGDILNMLTTNFGASYVFDTVIHRSVRHREATVHNQTIFEHAPGQLPSDQFLALAKEVVAKITRAEEIVRDYNMRQGNRG